MVKLLTLSRSRPRANFSVRGHRVQHARDDLRRAGSCHFVGDFCLEQLGVRQNDAELVGVSRRTIYNWIASGKVEYVRTAGGSVRIFVDTLWREPGRAQDLTRPEAS